MPVLTNDRRHADPDSTDSTCDLTITTCDTTDLITKPSTVHDTPDCVSNSDNDRPDTKTQHPAPPSSPSDIVSRPNSSISSHDAPPFGSPVTSLAYSFTQLDVARSPTSASDFVSRQLSQDPTNVLDATRITADIKGQSAFRPRTVSEPLRLLRPSETMLAPQQDTQIKSDYKNPRHSVTRPCAHSKISYPKRPRLDQHNNLDLLSTTDWHPKHLPTDTAPTHDLIFSPAHLIPTPFSLRLPLPLLLPLCILNSVPPSSLPAILPHDTVSDHFAPVHSYPPMPNAIAQSIPSVSSFVTSFIPPSTAVSPPLSHSLPSPRLSLPLDPLTMSNTGLTPDVSDRYNCVEKAEYHKRTHTANRFDLSQSWDWLEDSPNTTDTNTPTTLSIAVPSVITITTSTAPLLSSQHITTAYMPIQHPVHLPSYDSHTPD